MGVLYDAVVDVKYDFDNLKKEEPKLEKKIQSLAKKLEKLTVIPVSFDTKKVVKDINLTLKTLRPPTVKVLADTSDLKAVQSDINKINGRKIDTKVNIDDSDINAVDSKISGLDGEVIDTTLNVDDSDLDATQSKISGMDGEVIDTKITVDDSELEGLNDTLGGLEERIGGSKGQGIFGGLLGGASVLNPKLLATGASVAGVGIAFKKSYDSIVNFDEQIRRVSTVMSDTSAPALANIKQGVIDLSRETGIATDVINSGLYDALSAGIPQDNVFDFLTQAGKASIAGSSDVATSVKVISSAVNLYGKDALNAEQASDALFKTVQLGVTTFPELAQSLGDVLPIAKLTGLSINDVGAAIATLTAKGGLSTPKAVTSLNTALSELNVPTSKASELFKSLTGKTFPDFIKEGGNVADGIALIGDKAKTLEGGIAGVFGQEAVKSIATLSDATSGFKDTLTQVNDATGATSDAFDKIAGGKGFRVAKLFNSLKTSFLELSEVLLAPVLDTFLDTIEFLGRNLDYVIPIIIALGTAITIALIPAIISLAGAFTALAVPVIVATAPFIAIGVAIAGVVASVIYAYKHFKIFRDIVDNVFSFIITIIKNIIPAFKSFISFIINLGEVIGKGFAPIIDIIGKFIDIFEGLFTLDFKKISDSVGQIFDIINELGYALLDFIVPLLKNLGSSILNGIKSLAPILGRAFVSLFKTVFDFLKNIPYGDIAKSIGDGLLNILKAIFIELPQKAFKFLTDAFKAIFTLGSQIDTVAVGKSLLDSFINVLKFIFVGIPSRVLGFIKNIDWGQVIANVVEGFFDGLVFIFTLPARLGGILKDVLIKSWDFVKNINWGNVGKNIVKAIGKLFISIGTDLPKLIWDTLWKSITTAWDFITAVNWLGVLKTILKGFNNLVLLIVVELPKLLGKGIVTAFTSAFNFLKDIDWLGVGANILQFLKDALGFVFITIPTFLASKFTDLINGIGEFFLNIEWGDTTTKIFNAIFSLFETVFIDLPTKLGELFLSGLKSAWGFVKDIDWGEIVSNIFDAIVNLYTLIWVDLPVKLFEITKSGLKIAWDFITGSLPELLKGFLNFFTALPSLTISAIGNLGSKIWDALQSGFNYLSDKIGGFLTGLVSKVTSIMSGVGDAISGAFTNALNLSIKGINGLIGGINFFLKKIGVGTIPLIPTVGTTETTAKGRVRRKHSGGYISTADTPTGMSTFGGERLTADEVPTILQAGELVIPKNVVAQIDRPAGQALIDGRFNDFAEQMAGKKGIKSRDLENIDYNKVKSVLSSFETGGINFSSVISNLSKSAGKVIDLAKAITEKTARIALDQGVNAVESALSSIKDTLPGRMMVGFAKYLRETAIKFLFDPIEKEANRQGVYGALDLHFANSVAEKAAKNVSPQIIAEVASMRGKPNSYRTLLKYGYATGIPMIATSTIRKGSITSSGNISNHAYGRAVDWAGLTPSVDSTALGNIFWAHQPIFPMLDEAIYAGPQTTFNIKKGRRVPKYAQDDHHNHDHMALHTGGLVGTDEYKSTGISAGERIIKAQVGEFVVRREAVQKLGVERLKQINEGSDNSRSNTQVFNIQGITIEQVLAYAREQQRIQEANEMV